ncbi:MAG: nitrogenase molybdenum-iron protein [Firmicutes bacterium]|nr:nitrogenase molybdenum-iron protein [Bacillota bacterium]
MKGLLKYLSPFAPDQSGAVSVFYELGGIIVICDAGGCTGNICGFDEPRWFQERSAIFSAGLRDMDAILGRDDRLVEKLKDAAKYLNKEFALIIGTPVPAVIATDMKAMKRMATKRCGMPVMSIETIGTRLYDRGAQDAYMELFQTYVEDTQEKSSKTGILGCIPLDISVLDPKAYIQEEDYYCYGMGDGLEAIKRAGSVERNIVVSPASYKLAVYLQKRFGTPFSIEYPFLPDSFEEELNNIKDKKVLVLHQQVAAHEIRNLLRKNGCDVTIGTWFMEIPELKEAQDLHFEKENTFIETVLKNEYDVIIGDPAFKRALKGFTGKYIELAHFAVSGKFADASQNALWK